MLTYPSKYAAKKSTRIIFRGIEQNSEAEIRTAEDGSFYPHYILASETSVAFLQSRDLSFEVVQ